MTEPSTPDRRTTQCPVCGQWDGHRSGCEAVVTDHHFTPCAVDTTSADMISRSYESDHFAPPGGEGVGMVAADVCCAGIGGGELCGRPRSAHILPEHDQDITPPGARAAPTPFERELESLINRHSVENESDTPDFILAGYLRGCLDVWDAAIKDRDRWYGFRPWPDQDKPLAAPDD